MDSITRLSQKILVERARQGVQRGEQTPDTAPPPYSAEEDSSDSDEDDSEEEEDTPLKLTINAANSIQGSNNLVPTSPTPLADATRFSALLLHAVNRINDAAAAATPQRRRMKVDLTINCGTTVVGDRNVIGNVGLKPKAPERAIAGPGARMEEKCVVLGAKRRAEEDADGEPSHKRMTISPRFEP